MKYAIFIAVIFLTIFGVFAIGEQVLNLLPDDAWWGFPLWMCTGFALFALLLVIPTVTAYHLFVR